MVLWQTITMADQSWDWKEYYDEIEDRPSKALINAIENYSKAPGYALDIGAGSLRDTKYLLNNGFRVVAIDPSPVSTKMAEDLNNPSLTVFPGFAGAYEFPDNHFLLINAQGILFHFPKARFDFIMDKIKKSLQTGGIFVGNFIGEKDTWNYEGTTKTITTSNDLRNILKDYDIVFMKEFESDDTPALTKIKGLDKPKHWHQINVIAIKK